MKVSDLKLKTVYIGRGGKERLLVDRSQNSAVTEKVHKVTITTGNIFYLGNEKVVVSFVYSMFNLVRVHYVDNNQEFVVDAAALSENPDETSTINLALFTKKEPSNE